jgi:hypothetical protein
LKKESLNVDEYYKERRQWLKPMYMKMKNNELHVYVKAASQYLAHCWILAVPQSYWIGTSS